MTFGTTTIHHPPEYIFLSSVATQVLIRQPLYDPGAGGQVGNHPPKLPSHVPCHVTRVLDSDLIELLHMGHSYSIELMNRCYYITVSVTQKYTT